VDDARLLRFYLERGGPEARWNLSPECSYLDYRLHSWAAEQVLSGGHANVLNVGIGAGAWDDWLGYLLEGRGQLSSVDVDADIADMLRYRQRREGHPNPARVLCADLLRDEITGGFDVVTVIGSTASETGAWQAALAAAARLLGDGGRLFYCDFHHLNPPEAFPQLAAEIGLHVVHHDQDRTLPGLGFYLYIAHKRAA